MSRRTSRSKPSAIPSGDGSEHSIGGSGAKRAGGGASRRAGGGGAKRSNGAAAKASLDRSAAKSSLDGGSKSSLSGAAKSSPDNVPKPSPRTAAKASLDGGAKRSLDSSSAKSSPNSGSKPASSVFESYNSHLFTSSCCHQFNIHEGPMCICSQCKRLITQLKDDEVLTVSVKFNNSLESNVSADIQNSFKLKAKRFATDPTYELCGRKCPKCKSLCRYTRDAQMNILFICSNSSCRYVFNDE